MKGRTHLLGPLAVLGVIHALVFFPGFFTPYDPTTQDRTHPFAPPTRIRFVDGDHRFHLRPFVYRLMERDPGSAAYQEDRSRAYPVRFFVPGPRYKVAGLFVSRWHLFGVEKPGKLFLLGTDDYGRDQFTRLLYGGQISLLAGLLAAGLSLSLGSIVGTLSGFYGGWFDEGVMRVTELFLALPWLYLLFAVRAFLPLQISPGQAFLVLVVIIGAIGWARPARLIRGIALSARERNFVLAARGFGASDLYLLRRHILPQTFGVLLTQAALLVPQFVLAEVTLSFLGLGVGEPSPSWGNLLASLQQYHVLASYWWMLIPAFVLIPVFGSYHALARVLEERTRFASV